MIAIEHLLLMGAMLILVSIAVAKATDNLGVPTLLLFIGVGMLAGSEGPGGIAFDNAALAQALGIAALSLILFAGGMSTGWPAVRPVAGPAAALATAGVLLTALAIGAVTYLVAGMPLLESLLLGAIISSTDAAAVFAVLRSRHVSLRGRLRPLLELESGSNDPMAVLLTLCLLQAITGSGQTPAGYALFFVRQLGIGAAVGLALGRAMAFTINKLRYSHQGVYPVFVLAGACLSYGLAAVLGGSGFLAVYLAGIVFGNGDVVQKKSLLRFFDSLAWLSQVAMFIALGLLVYPSHLAQVLVPGLAVSLALVFLARPLSVFAILSFTGMAWREKLLVSWVGLRGAVPIVLATFPMLAGIGHAETIFNLVFFIVLTSALVQGWSVPLVARLLRVDAPLPARCVCPMEFEPAPGGDTELVDLTVPYRSQAAGKTVVELGIPDDCLVTLIGRGNGYLVPSGGTVIEEGDTLLILAAKARLPEIVAQLSKLKPEG